MSELAYPRELASELYDHGAVEDVVRVDAQPVDSVSVCLRADVDAATFREFRGLAAEFDCRARYERTVDGAICMTFERVLTASEILDDAADESLGLDVDDLVDEIRDDLDSRHWGPTRGDVVDTTQEVMSNRGIDTMNNLDDYERVRDAALREVDHE